MPVLCRSSSRRLPGRRRESVAASTDLRRWPVDCPSCRPSCPMLAKSVKGDPRPRQVRTTRTRLSLRAEVGRVPVHRLQGRRRGRAGLAQHQAADPLLPRGRGGRSRAAPRAVRAGRRAVRRAIGPTGWSSRCSRSGSTRPQSRIKMLAETDARRRSSPSTCSPSATRPESDRPFAVRRARLEAALGGLGRRPMLPHPHDDGPGGGRGGGSTQFEGAGLDGVVAKPLAAPYQQNARTMLKIKHERTADVVVAGYRLHKTSTAGAAAARLAAARPVRRRASSSTSGSRRRSPSRGAPSCSRSCSRSSCRHRRPPVGRVGRSGRSPTPTGCPGTQSRWSAGKDLSFTPLRPERVLEVGYDAHGGPSGSGTPRSSSAGGRTATRSPAATSSSRSRSSYDLD